MHRIVILTFLYIVVITFDAYCETYLCIGEQGAAVMHGGRDMSVEKYNFSAHKYLLTNSNGSWVLKDFANGVVILDECFAADNDKFVNSCRKSGHYFSGYFIRDSDNTFTMDGFRQDDRGRVFRFLLKGLCGKI